MSITFTQRPRTVYYEAVDRTEVELKIYEKSKCGNWIEWWDVCQDLKGNLRNISTLCSTSYNVSSPNERKKSPRNLTKPKNHLLLSLSADSIFEFCYEVQSSHGEMTIFFTLSWKLLTECIKSEKGEKQQKKDECSNAHSSIASIYYNY